MFWRGVLPNLLALLVGALGCATGRSAGDECMLSEVAGSGAVPVRWATCGSEAQHAPWRRPVGSAVFAPSGGSGATPPVDRLAVVSWNTHVGGADLLRFVRHLREGQFTGGAPPDGFVLLLQEAHRAGGDIPDYGAFEEPVKGAARILPHADGGARVDIREAAEQIRDVHLFYVPSMRNGKGEDRHPREDRGNAILSSVPLEDPAAVELPLEVQRRVAVAARLRGKTSSGREWCLGVVDTHLDNFALRRGLANFGGFRADQVRGLMDGLLPLGVLTDVAPDVLGGDFNTWWREEKEPAVGVVETYFGTPGANPGDATSHRRWSPDRRIDFLFGRRLPLPPLSYARLGSRYGSDHFPLVAVLDLTRGGLGC